MISSLIGDHLSDQWTSVQPILLPNSNWQIVCLANLTTCMSFMNAGAKRSEYSGFGIVTG